MDSEMYFSRKVDEVLSSRLRTRRNCSSCDDISYSLTLKMFYKDSLFTVESYGRECFEYSLNTPGSIFDVILHSHIFI